jgi:hypothetical protein
MKEQSMNVMKWFIVLAVVSGCASLNDARPAAKVFSAKSTYDAALTLAVAYKRLPPCGQPTSPTLCSDKETVATIQKADTVSFEALNAAEKVVRDPKAAESARQTAVAWATESAAAFNRVASQLPKGSQ